MSESDDFDLQIDLKMQPNYKKGDYIDSRYEILEFEGGGGFGRVLQVRDQSTGERIALKYCTSDDDVDLRRFEREVRILQSIRHENVVPILSFNADHYPPYFTMPLARETVSQYTARTEMNMSEVIPVFEEMCKGVAAIHAAGFTHRDIKPPNALIFEKGQVAVSDLGLARFNERDTTILTRTIDVMGTNAYIPPEALELGGTQNLDHRGDIFMLGKTLYNMLTNRNPLHMSPKGIHPGMWIIIEKATDPEVDSRYQSVDEFLDALHDVKRATDPNMNLKKLFNSQLELIMQAIAEGRKDPEPLSKMVRTLLTIDDPDTIIEYVHRIPYEIIQMLAKPLSADVEHLMRKYYVAIDQRISFHPWAEADHVYRGARQFVQNTSSNLIKKYAIVSTLLAAYRLNRYDAMSAFDEMLQEIRTDEDAFAVAAGLRDKLQVYKQLYHRVNKPLLHPAIQSVWEACERLKEEE